MPMQLVKSMSTSRPRAATSFLIAAMTLFPPAAMPQVPRPTTIRGRSSFFLYCSSMPERSSFKLLIRYHSPLFVLFQDFVQTISRQTTVRIVVDHDARRQAARPDTCHGFQCEAQVFRGAAVLHAQNILQL